MKNKKSLLALILVVSMVLSLAPNVFAQAVSWIKTSKTVTGYVYDYDSEGGFIIHDYDENYILKESVLVRPNGNVVTAPKGTKITNATNKYYVIKSMSEYKSAIYDMNNKEIVPMGKYSEITLVDDTYFMGETYDDDWGTKAGLFKYDGTVMIPMGKYSFWKMDVNADLKMISVTNETGAGIVDFTGKVVLPLGKYQLTNDWYDGENYSVENKLIVVNKEAGTGVEDFNGNIVIPLNKEYKKIIFTNDKDRFVAVTETTYKVIDRNGKVYLEIPYERNQYNYVYCQVYDGGILFRWQSEKEAYYDFNGKLLVEKNGDGLKVPSFSGLYTTLSSDYIKVFNKDGKSAIADAYGNLITEYKKEVSHEVYDNKYIYVESYTDEGDQLYDTTGNIIVAPQKGTKLYVNTKANMVARTDSEGKITFGKISAERPISVIVNGKKVKFDQSPILDNGRTLVPIRAIAEALGAKVDWDGDTQTAVITLDGVTVKIKIDSNIMTVNGSSVKLDVPAKVINGRTLVPVRAISEAFKCTVDWDGVHNTVLVKK